MIAICTAAPAWRTLPAGCLPRTSSPLTRRTRAPDSPRRSGTLEEFVTEWAAGRAPFGSWSAHLKSWLSGEAAADPRVLVVSYEELKKDLRGCVGRVNSHCGFGLSDARLDELLPRFAFEWMRANEAQFHPRSVRWVQRKEDTEDFHFIRAGRVGDGATAVSAQVLQQMVAKTFPSGRVPGHVARLL